MRIRTAILTVSDRSFSGERDDLSGPALQYEIEKLGWSLVSFGLVPDSKEAIEHFLLNHSESGMIDLILTTGGTGFSTRDVTPEATLAVIEKRAPGLVEVIRFESSKITPFSYLSRAEAGIHSSCLIINLPGNPKAAVESLRIIANIIPHAIALLQQNDQSDIHSIKN